MLIEKDTINTMEKSEGSQTILNTIKLFVMINRSISGYLFETKNTGKK